MADVAGRMREFSVRLWQVVNDYVVTAGGNPGRSVYGNTPRQEAVAAVEDHVMSCWMERESVRGWLHEIRMALADHEGENPPNPKDTPQAVRNLIARAEGLEEQAERLHEQIERLSGWLQEIDGGDYPIHDADRLRNMAFAALRGDEVTDG